MIIDATKLNLKFLYLYDCNMKKEKGNEAESQSPAQLGLLNNPVKPIGLFTKGLWYQVINPPNVSKGPYKLKKD